MPRVVLLGSSPGPDAATGQATPPAALTLPALPGCPTVIGKLHGQLASIDPEPVTIARSSEAAAYRGFPGSLVETSDLAGDLRAVAEAAEAATENLLILPANSLIHDELIYQITKSKRGALALIVREPREEDENGDAVVPDVPIEEAQPEIGDRTLEDLPVRVRARRSRIISVGSAFHAVTRPNAVLLGPLHLHHKHAPVLAEAARELADMAHLLYSTTTWSSCWSWAWSARASRSASAAAGTCSSAGCPLPGRPSRRRPRWSRSTRTVPG